MGKCLRKKRVFSSGLRAEERHKNRDAYIRKIYQVTE